MQLRKIARGRKGFTLVEVALAVAVGLIIIGGAVLGYNAVKDNASNSNARNRVLSGVTMIEEYAAANGGRYPASAVGTGSFSTMWSAKRPDDKNLSPWGGTCGAGTGAGTLAACGVSEFAPVDFGSTAAPTAASAAIVTTTVVGNAANLCYVTPSAAANPWGAVTATSTSSLVTVKNYALGIYDKEGIPWWDCKGGK